MLSLLLAAALAPSAFTLINRDHAIVDRVPIEIERYRSSLPPAQALAAWDPSAITSSGAGPVGSRQRGPHRETLQARVVRGGGSELLLSRIDLRRPRAAPPRLPFTLPAGSVVLRAVQFESAAATFVVSLPGHPAGAFALLCARLRAEGWSLPREGGCDSGGPGAHWFLRGGATLAIDLRAAARGSRAVIARTGERP